VKNNPGGDAVNPLLVIVVVLVFLIACGVVYDLRRRRLDAARRDTGLETRDVRGAAESHGGVGGSDIQGRYGGPGL
jgi:hypothetical protein